jgi:hypothetical protein
MAMSTPYDPPLGDFQSELERRAHVRPDAPPEGFDPVHAGDDDLEQFGFPPRPDPQLQPAEYYLWTQLFTPPLTYIKATFTFTVPYFLRSGSARAAEVATRHRESGNWSGGFITPRDGRMFTWLYGSWYVPAVTPPASAAAGSEYRSSTWIGLDGQRRYVHSSLPQIGTAQTAFAGLPPQTPTTWFQWWLRDQVTPIVTLPLPVSSTDLVRCLMIVLNDTQVLFTMLNVSTATLLLPFIVDSPTDPQIGGQLKVSGATAEWIMERPTDYATGSFWGLPNYGTVRFVDSLAISERVPLSLAGRGENVVGARLIDMFDVRQPPPRAVLISRAERFGTREVRTSFVP